MPFSLCFGSVAYNVLISCFAAIYCSQGSVCMTESEKLHVLFCYLHFPNTFLWMLNHNFELHNIFVSSDCFKSG